MAELLVFKNAVRDFLRKYDEIAIPVLKFIASLILFISVNSMFGYSELFGKGIVIFLLSVLSALLSGAFTLFITGVDIAVHSFALSTEVGLVFVIIFIVMYCMYVKFFPRTSYIILISMVLCFLKIPYVIPLAAAVLAGYAGIVPVAFGVVLYYFSSYASDIADMLNSAADIENLTTYQYLIDDLFKDKTMLLYIMCFVIAMLVVCVIYRMQFDYSWYIAIAVGGVVNIIVFLIGGYAVDVNISIIAVLFGTILGMIVAVIIQFFKGIVDYSRKEIVQFEDDDYYYYVKAVPKLKVSSANKNVKKINTGKSNKQ